MKPKKKLPMILTIAVLAGGLIYLLAAGFDDTVVYYKTVDELLANPARFETRPVRINGVLVAGSVRAKPGTNEYRFLLTKRNQTLEVSFSGVLPDTMQEGQELVVHGVFNASEKIFHASEILTKCPSKYESQAKSIR
jgi:cytochrome c-type biogenesis protein CcmE